MFSKHLLRQILPLARLKNIIRQDYGYPRKRITDTVTSDRRQVKRRPNQNIKHNYGNTCKRLTVTAKSGKRRVERRPNQNNKARLKLNNLIRPLNVALRVYSRPKQHSLGKQDKHRRTRRKTDKRPDYDLPVTTKTKTTDNHVNNSSIRLDNDLTPFCIDRDTRRIRNGLSKSRQLLHYSYSNEVRFIIGLHYVTISNRHFSDPIIGDTPEDGLVKGKDDHPGSQTLDLLLRKLDDTMNMKGKNRYDATKKSKKLFTNGINHVFPRNI